MRKNSSLVRWQFHRVTEWDAHKATWDRVNAEAGALPILESAFLGPLLMEFGSGSETIAIGRSGDRPVAVALLAPPRRGMWSTFQPGQLPVGPWLVEHGFDPIELAQDLLRCLPGINLGLGLTQMDPDLYPRPPASAVVKPLDHIPTAWIAVEGSYQAYWEARGRNLRAGLRKQRNKLEADGVTITFDTLTSPNDVAEAIGDFGRLETASWKGAIGTAIHPSNGQGRFYTAMMTKFCELGRGRIWRLKFDQKVVAMDLCIEGGGVLVMLKTTFDAEFKSVSPTFLMRQMAFQQVFDAGLLRRIEFYGRVMDWNARWTDKSRVIYHTNIFRWALVPAFRDLLRRGVSEPPAADIGANAQGAASSH